MSKTNLGPQAIRTNGEIPPGDNEAFLNGSRIKADENKNKPTSSDHPNELPNEIGDNLGNRDAQKKNKLTIIGGNEKTFEVTQGQLTEIDTNGTTFIVRDQNGKSINGDHIFVFQDKINQTSSQPENDPTANKQGTQSKTGGAPELHQPNSNEADNQKQIKETGETGKTSKTEDKKEANNDDDSGVNLAEFFRAKENIDEHIEKKGKGDGLDDALVKCLSKTPGVKIIRKGFFGKFGEPAAIKYRGVTMSFHKGHVVASGEGNVREIVQDLLTKIKPTDTASGNSEHKDAEVNPETGELTVGGRTYSFPVPRKDVVVLIQNSDGDSAFAPDELKKSTSLTYKTANQLTALNKDDAFRQRYFPGTEVNFAESIAQMKNNSTDPERSKNNVYPFARRMFNAVSERLNVVSSWVDNSTDNILQQDLKIANPDLLLNIYEQYAQEEEATKNQQNQARDINERAKEIAERTINEYNLFSGQKLEENSEIAVMAFLKKLYQDNPQILALESSFANSDSRIGLTREDIERTIAQAKNAIVQGALKEAREARNALDDFNNDNSEHASNEDNDLNFDDDLPSKIDSDNDNKSGQFASLNRDETVSESTNNENDSQDLNAQSSDGAAAEENDASYVPGTNPFDPNDDD